MKTNNVGKPVFKVFTWLLISAVTLQLPYFSFQAFAGSDILDPSGIKSDQLGTATQSCNNVCKDMMVGPQREKSVDGGSNSSGSGSGWALPGIGAGEVASKWDRLDDQWCANHGEETNHAVQNEHPSSEYTAPGENDVPISQMCPYRLTPIEETKIRQVYTNNKSKAALMCDDIKKGILLCKFRNTQMESYCKAYLASEQDINWQWLLIALDAAAAETCAAECLANKGAGKYLMGASYCTKLACVAGVAEVVGAIAVEDSTLGRLTKATMGAVGGTAKCKEWKKGENPASEEPAPAPTETVTPPTPTEDAAMAPVKSDPQRDPVVKVAILLGPKFTLAAAVLASRLGPEAFAEAGNKNACTAAISFALLGGIRAYNIIKAGNTKDSSCKSVNSLLSQAKVADPNGSPTSDYSNNAAPGYDSNGNFTSGGGYPNGNNVGSYGEQGGASIVDENGDGCDDNDGSCTSATDAQMLSNGLGRVLKPQTDGLDKNDFLKKLNDEGYGSIMSGMSSAATGDFGAALAEIGDTASKEGANSSVNLGPSASQSYTSGGSGSSRGPGQTGDQSNPFGSLIGGSKGRTTIGSHSATFGNARSMDIWHTGSQDTIFKIVTQKIHTVANRVK